MQRFKCEEMKENLLKYMGLKKEDNWKGCGSEPGLEIWRIEKGEAAAWPKEQYGNFYSGDSFIILHTAKDVDHFDYNIHLWIGDKSQKEEAAVAQYKIVELDEYLKGDTVMFFESEGNESPTFLSYFKIFTILEGGVTPSIIKPGKLMVNCGAFMPKLFHIHGRGNTVHSKQIPINMENLDEKDVFVLDAGLKVFNWRGKNSTGFEKMQGTIVSNKIWEERNKMPELISIEQGENNTDFSQLMEKYKEDVKKEDEPCCEGKKKLMWLHEDNGKISFEEVPFAKASLKSEDIFIIDDIHSIYVWVGNGASKSERRFSMVYAKRYLTNEGKNANCPIVTVREGKMEEQINKCFT